MKRMLFLLAMLLGGTATGGGAALGVHSWRGGAEPAGPTEKEREAEPRVFVPTGPVLTPLVFPDGSLVGYSSIEVQLEVSADDAETVKQRLPLLLHAINLQTFRQPLAAGPDGSLPDLVLFRRLVLSASTHAFGRGTVRQAAITQARPA